MRTLFAVVSIIASPVLAAPAKVTGFSYEWPKSLESNPALVRHLKKDRDARLRAYAALFAQQHKGGAPLSYEDGTSWKLQTRLAGMTVLVGQRWEYTGGAHGNGFTDALMWDNKAATKLSFAQLFTNAKAAEKLLTSSYCQALDTARLAKRNGEPTPKDDMFGDCPKLFESAKIWLDKPVYDKFSRIAMSLPPYTAGPYAEGSYDLEIVIPKGLRPLVKPQYRMLFPG